MESASSRLHLASTPLGRSERADDRFDRESAGRYPFWVSLKKFGTKTAGFDKESAGRYPFWVSLVRNRWHRFGLVGRRLVVG